MSLRARLLLVVVALLAAGLLAANVATYTVLRSFLVDRVDQQLGDAVRPAVHALTDPGPPDGGPGGERGGAGPTFLYAELRAPDGTTTETLESSLSSDPAPALPAALPGATADHSGRREATFETGAESGSIRYRVRAVAVPEGTVVVAAPLTDVNDTLNQLLLVELVVSLAVLLVAAVLAWWLVRRGLRPLDRIGETAGAIAAGDLSRRVDTVNPRTEVGRLGIALNVMLTRIEEAFAERRRSEERLRRFVADASHELRTPLTSIRGYAELFRVGAASRPQDLEKAMTRIEQESGRMSVLVDDLLLLARLDQGRPLERGPVDLGAIAADAIGDARAVEPDRPWTLDVHVPVAVDGDDQRLRQVVANLIANVRVHTPAGAAATLRVLERDGHGVIEVADHGPGLPPDVGDRVFERFFRADEGRDRKHGGTGLGLSIVASIVEAHGGRVEVEPTPGGGATFRVVLPLAGAAAPEPGPVAAATGPAA